MGGEAGRVRFGPRPDKDDEPPEQPLEEPQGQKRRDTVYSFIHKKDVVLAQFVYSVKAQLAINHTFGTNTGVTDNYQEQTEECKRGNRI